jgi:hypothetical protein
VEIEEFLVICTTGGIRSFGSLCFEDLQPKSSRDDASETETLHPAGTYRFAALRSQPKIPNLR